MLGIEVVLVGIVFFAFLLDDGLPPGDLAWMFFVCGLFAVGAFFVGVLVDAVG